MPEATPLQAATSTSQPPARPRVLITGAAGLVGAALARTLAGRGYRVRGLVRTRDQRSAELERAGVEVSPGDIRDDAAVADAVAGMEIVYNLAGVVRPAGTPGSEYRAVHVDAVRRLIEASARAGVGRVVQCSTVAVHGNVSREAPATEDAPLRPQDIYQQTKLEGERIALETSRRTGVPLTIVRPGPVYGPGDRRLYNLIGAVARRRFLLLGDGSPRLQMVFVDDMAEGLRLAGETPAAAGRTYIITGEEAPTLREAVDEIAAAAHVPPPRLRLPVWPFWLLGAACEAVCLPLGINPPIFRRRVMFFVNNRWFDTTRARTELGFVPRVPLRVGLVRTLDSYRELGWI